MAAVEQLHVPRDAFLDSFADLEVARPGKLKRIQQLLEMSIVHIPRILSRADTRIMPLPPAIDSMDMGHAFHFHAGPPGQPFDFHHRSRRLVIAKKLLINTVEHSKLTDIGQEHID